eukprot:CAMPEP_0172582756 /NCGR_PEP_ID=MMETSP1068-20121228/2284_1 /TAXON_ID=35684 /ORGANISM="Pseudopedinella elastica, Strain CCMP716" /LENGTH=151 /DNA_ID=CAMNT_0013376275 /DNA_START=613 /DNA_END=1069 /DNA_ORIENTATION=+
MKSVHRRQKCGRKLRWLVYRGHGRLRVPKLSLGVKVSVVLADALFHLPLAQEPFLELDPLSRGNRDGFAAVKWFKSRAALRDEHRSSAAPGRDSHHLDSMNDPPASQDQVGHEATSGETSGEERALETEINFASTYPAAYSGPSAQASSSR